jgi:hypothetical protein
MDELRQRYSELLGDNVEYLCLKENTKSPKGSFSPGKKNRFQQIPEVGNYGIIPTGRIIILDVDTHTQSEKVDNQVAFFSDFLHTELSNTLTVTTPSGGKHFYLRVPYSLGLEELQLLPKSTLRPYRKEIMTVSGREIQVDADIRTSAVNAYVVGPSSVVEDSEYFLSEGHQISLLPEQGIANLMKVAQLRSDRKRKPKKVYTNVDIWEGDPLEVAQEPMVLSIETPPSIILKKIDLGLRAQGKISYHQKRAFVKTALHCCYSNDAIAKACIELEIDKDSFSGSRLRRYSLQIDIHSFQPEAVGHNKYCIVGVFSDQLTRTNGLDLNQNLARLRQRQVRRGRKTTLSKNRVLDLNRIMTAISKDRSARFIGSKECLSTIILIENFFHPLSCAGAEKMVMAKGRVAPGLGLTESQLARAMRLLRAANVIEIADRQRTGLASTYRINPYFVDSRLTNLLLYAKIEFQQDLIYSYRDCNFCNGLGEVIYTPKDTSNLQAQEFQQFFRKYSSNPNIFNQYLGSGREKD